MTDLTGLTLGCWRSCFDTNKSGWTFVGCLHFIVDWISGFRVLVVRSAMTIAELSFKCRIVFRISVGWSFWDRSKMERVFLFTERGLFWPCLGPILRVGFLMWWQFLFMAFVRREALFGRMLTWLVLGFIMALRVTLFWVLLWMGWKKFSCTGWWVVWRRFWQLLAWFQ